MQYSSVEYLHIHLSHLEDVSWGDQLSPGLQEWDQEVTLDEWAVRYMNKQWI
jgi:hypothetical protein